LTVGGDLPELLISMHPARGYKRSRLYFGGGDVALRRPLCKPLWNETVVIAVAIELESL
jgi:hypothetical protein